MEAKLIKTKEGSYQLKFKNDDDMMECSLGLLSLKNCEEIFGVVDVESLALSRASFFGGAYRTPEGFSDEQVGYLHGFIEAMELNKDKLFTEEDVITAIVHYTYLLYNDGKGYEEGDNNDDRIECVIASLKQKPIEKEVEIEMEHIIYHANMPEEGEERSAVRPKLDENGYLILKRL
jgi:hypothetical protein